MANFGIGSYPMPYTGTPQAISQQQPVNMYNGYNPYPTTNGYQNGMSQQGYQNQSQQPQPQNNGQQGFACRPVTSKEEALAVQVDFFGPGTIMPDLAHGLIHFKRFNNNTGSSEFATFAYMDPNQQTQSETTQQAQQQNTALIAEFAPVFQAFNEKFDNISTQINELFGKIEQIKPTVSQKGSTSKGNTQQKEANVNEQSV